MKTPALRGGALALLASLLFGISTPLVQRFGIDVGPLTTAALLYLGATLVGAMLRRPIEREARIVRTDVPRLVAVAFFGAAVGPVALAWGLQHTNGTSASLMLTLEAVFTAVLARLLYREVMDSRVWTAVLLLVAGGALLVLDQGRLEGAQMLGLLAVMIATAAWGIDNTLSRALAERDPGQVVMVKAALGATTTALLAVALGEPMPTAVACVALLLIGGTGYGLSLRFYLLAQRAFGAARTGSVFAFAPFIGGLVAFGLGERSGSWLMVLGGALMLSGVLLHLIENHEHVHEHEVIDHEHAHAHDDGHHDHVHAEPVAGPHSHRHVHTPVRHSHSHVPDAHHTHGHG